METEGILHMVLAREERKITKPKHREKKLQTLRNASLGLASELCFNDVLIAVCFPA